MKQLNFFVCVVGCLGALAAGEAWAGGEGHQWDGNQSTPVHLLPMVDEDGFRILPAYKEPMPFSARTTCGTCHDYDTISSGFHFNSASENARHGRPGEPWIWLDELTGTQLPLSYRGWPGTYRPEELGISKWDFTKQFGRHLPGGDMAEPEELYGDPMARWHISGGIEINCLGCHSESPLQDQSEWAKQIARENFRWAATAASELASVSGIASRLPIDWEMHQGFSPDDKIWATPPVVTYEVDAFNAKDLTQFQIQYRMKDDNCLYCHSASDINAERWEQDMDVHLTSGMLCVDCHRNGLNHDIIRGYEGEAAERGEPAVGDFSCLGCHMGNPDGEGASVHGGRLGAPKPLHEGMPEIHFDKLSCTACHSGRWPKETPSTMRASRINRTGIHGIAQWFTEHPYVDEPVFLPDATGKIAPHRAVWPAFWAKLDGDDLRPLPPRDLEDVAIGILDVEEQIGTLISNMSTIMLSDEVAGHMQGLVAFLTPGRDFRVNYDGKLEATDYEVPTAGNERNKYPIFEGGYLWAIEKDILKLDELEMPLMDDDGNDVVDYVQIQPMVNTFEPVVPDDMDYTTYDEIVGALIALAYKNEDRGEAVLVKGNRLYTRTEGDLLESEELESALYPVPTPLFRKDGELLPLVPDFAAASIQVTSGTDMAFNEKQVEVMLTALKARDGGDYGYVGSGKLFRLGEDGALTAAKHEAAEPYTWPIGHEVRPAEQSLGSGGCAECHASDAPFLMSMFAASGPLDLDVDDRVASVMHENFDTVGPAYPKTALFFKWLIIITMTLLLTHIALDVYRQMTRSRAGQ